uniref:Uncharacterized protein n=1 Tax=Cacopsylla melanoneura TaxID=428564 RepID=A0A8D8ZFX5_9HEMI
MGGHLKIGRLHFLSVPSTDSDSTVSERESSSDGMRIENTSCLTSANERASTSTIYDVDNSPDKVRTEDTGCKPHSNEILPSTMYKEKDSADKIRSEIKTVCHSQIGDPLNPWIKEIPMRKIQITEPLFSMVPSLMWKI